MNTYHIHIKGIVQGVGFRPFVYKLAVGANLKGWVNNTLNGVHIEFNAEEKSAVSFYENVIKQAPSNARIYEHQLTQTSQQEYSTFEIIRSQESGEPDIPLTPDFALCPTCREELQDFNNHRFQYPFITCTYCGPRYSIAQKLPYDRHTTTMQPFAMCPTCKKEYDDPLDRRYYSQTNSCQTCGIELWFEDFNFPKNDYSKLSYQQTIDLVVKQLSQGKILAIKGIGGYLLVCDASNEKAIENLRTRKHRPTKPFAVMYPGFEELTREYDINESEKEALTNEVAYIVLLRKKSKQTNNYNVIPDTVPGSQQDEQHGYFEGDSRIESGKGYVFSGDQIASDMVTPGLNRTGCMLPYAPLYQLILDRFKKPIIATSGNVSGSPIIFEDEVAREELSTIADGILVHNRAIVAPQDDSVVSFTSINNQKIIHRRSRGLAPTYENSPFSPTNETVLSAGAQMKSSFSILTKNRVYVSQYLGDMDNYLTQNAYKHTVNHLQSILACKPEVLLADKHPLYFTTEWASEKAAEQKIPVHHFQHHKAHFAAVLAENNLLDSTEPIMGVIWDGTGMGDDKNIWGGEFFVYKNRSFERKEHIGYFPFILGDKMPREPRISALCVSNGLTDAETYVKPKFTEQEWNLYQKMLANHNGLMTSSMGRLFDAVAALLLEIDKTSYEGEAAIWLESHAEQYAKTVEFSFDYSYLKNAEAFPDNIGRYLISTIISELNKGVSSDQIAYSFHISLVDLIDKVTTKNAIRNIAFSGGVFQNKLLTDMMISLLQNDFRLFFHRQLSPNDECISFGQLACYQLTHKAPVP